MIVAPECTFESCHATRQVHPRGGLVGNFVVPDLRLLKGGHQISNDYRDEGLLGCTE